jgi:hypothetical protein
MGQNHPPNKFKPRAVVHFRKEVRHRSHPFFAVASLKGVAHGRAILGFQSGDADT